MALENVGKQDIITKEILSSVWDSMPPELMHKLELTINLGIALIVASITYLAIILLITLIKWIFGTRETNMLKKINNNLEEILNLERRKKSVKARDNKENKLKK